MNSTLHFFLHLLFKFLLEEKNLAFKLEKLLWNNKFMKVPFVEIIFYENQNGICFV
jgi:hypothetical protein